MIRVITGDCREELARLPAESVHCCVTSPPYFGLRDYGVDGQIGLEATIEAFVETMVAVFRDVRRVLRKDGTVWLNLGDSYCSIGHKKSSSGYGTTGLAGGKAQEHTPLRRENNSPGYKHKDLMMIPARVALALQADGWWLRSDIIWSKPNPMPESVTDRPTSAHEHVFLLAKSAKYYFDAEAVREDETMRPQNRLTPRDANPEAKFHSQPAHRRPEGGTGNGSRNLRNVWSIATAPFSEAHFATFPPALVEPCIKAGTSEKGCCAECGAPWVREIKIDHVRHRKGINRTAPRENSSYVASRGEVLNKEVKTLGWSLPCACDTPGTTPCTVLDCFGGAGTTGLVADRLGRNAILIELNPEYADMAKGRITKDGPLFANVETGAPDRQ